MPVSPLVFAIFFALVCAGFFLIGLRFFRMAERRIVEGTHSGIVSFISNYSWLDGLSFTAMRERYLEVFDKVWIDNLHGDLRIGQAGKVFR